MNAAIEARVLRPLGETIRSHRHLLSNAGSMLGTTVVTSLLGVGFWLLAAHDFSQDAVGVAAAAVGAMTLLGFLATLGLGTLLMGELPLLESGHRSLINAALAVTAAAGVVLGLLFAAIAPSVSPDLEPLRESWLALLSFGLGVGFTALAFVVDQALIGMLLGKLQLRRNGMFAAVKLAILIPIAALVVDPGAAWIYSAWGLGVAVSMVVLSGFYLRRAEDSLRPDFGRLVAMRSSAASHHAFNLALQIPGLALPVLVVGLVSATANASFYIAWMIAGLLVMVPVSLGTVLFPIGSRDPQAMVRGMRLTLRLSLGFGLLANLFLLVAATPILEVFGSEYAAEGASTLHILALGVFPLTFKTLYVTIHRVGRKLGRGLPIVWGGTILELVGAAVGAKLGGLTGVSLGWLAAVTIEGLVMGRDVVRFLRRPPSALLDEETPAPEPRVAASVDA